MREASAPSSVSILSKDAWLQGITWHRERKEASHRRQRRNKQAETLRVWQVPIALSVSDRASRHICVTNRTAELLCLFSPEQTPCETRGDGIPREANRSLEEEKNQAFLPPLMLIYDLLLIRSKKGPITIHQASTPCFTAEKRPETANEGPVH